MTGMILEADAVLHLDDGRYALIEFKLEGLKLDMGPSIFLKLGNL